MGERGGSATGDGASAAGASPEGTYMMLLLPNMTLQAIVRLCTYRSAQARSTLSEAGAYE
jgi:hypothetical protein